MCDDNHVIQKAFGPAIDYPGLHVVENVIDPQEVLDAPEEGPA